MVDILLMDDDEPFAEVLSEMLQRRNHKVTICSSATSARSQLEKTKFDLLITDLVVYQGKTPVPDGGISLITWLRGAQSLRNDPWLQEMPIIAISGAIHRHGMGNLLRVSEGLGADITLKKPTDPTELFDAIAKLCPR